MTENLNNIKILVGYHKPAKLLKDEYFVPIHLGRKNSKLSSEDNQWMFDNMIGDDTGDNISDLNKYFAEVTGIYWAWKNYDKLGNPEYIGLNHYRRIFSDNDIQDALKNDITVAFEKMICDSNSQFIASHHVSYLNEILNDLEKKEEWKQAVTIFKESTVGYFYNMFLMKKEFFFEFCEFIFPILFSLHEKLNYEELSHYNQRMPGFICERLLSLFFINKKLQGKKTHECQILFLENDGREIKPFKEKNNIPIVMVANDNYICQLGVAIQSIVENSSAYFNYDISILYKNLNVEHIEKIKRLSRKNVLIRFVNVKNFLNNQNNKFPLNSHFKEETYYRFFIPYIFKNYEKIIYLDCDIIVNKDVANLYFFDIGDCSFGAVKDFEVARIVFTSDWMDDTFKKYVDGTLKLKNIDHYFQAGVLLFNIKKLIEMNFTEKALQLLNQISNPIFVDQDILNKLLEDHVYMLPDEWNVEWHLPFHSDELQMMMKEIDYIRYINARKDPAIIHYCSVWKPWYEPEREFANVWWKYAKNTDLYPEIMVNLIEQKSNLIFEKYKKVNLTFEKLKQFKILRRKFFKYKILKSISFGKLHKKFKRRYKILKSQLNDIV